MRSVTHMAGAALLGLALYASSAHAEPAKTRALSEADVLKLVELAIDDQAIIDRVHAGGVDFKVDDAVIDRLKKAGASDAVLAALQGKDAPADGVAATGNHAAGVTLEIIDIKRTSDGFLQVSFRYRNPTNKPIKLYRGVLFVTAETDTSSYLIKSIYYVDPKNQLKYGIVSDENGRPLASPVRGKDVIAPAKDVSPTYWVKLASPDDDVRKVSFYFPDVPPIEDVPLPPPLKK